MSTQYNEYHPSRYGSNKVAHCESIESTSVIRAFTREYNDRFQGQWLQGCKVGHKQEAEWILSIINEYQPARYMSLLDIETGEKQQFTYIASNLRGYIFYFLCNGCDKKVKYLYRPERRWRFLCRSCHKLSY